MDDRSRPNLVLQRRAQTVIGPALAGRNYAYTLAALAGSPGYSLGVAQAAGKGGRNPVGERERAPIRRRQHNCRSRRQVQHRRRRQRQCMWVAPAGDGGQGVDRMRILGQALIAPGVLINMRPRLVATTTQVVNEKMSTMMIASLMGLSRRTPSRPTHSGRRIRSGQSSSYFMAAHHSHRSVTQN